MSESVESSAVPHDDGLVVVTTASVTSADNKVNATTANAAASSTITVTATTSLRNVGSNNGSNASSSVGTAPSATNKDNLIIVVNKVESDKGGGESGGVMGDVKVLPKTVTVVSSPASTGGALKKTVIGNTIVKMQKTGVPQTSPLGKRQMVIASRPGVNQIISCGQIVQQSAHASTPVILTQKVASGGIVTSPIVSTGGVNAAVTNVSGLGGSTKIVATTAAQAPQQRLQDVRVDNWGNYCLQRLKNMYDKGDFCDLTLRFHSSQEIKVHRVVVNLCTEYFSNLEKLYGLNEGTLILPKDVEFQTMQTIIKFFYTGKLEVRGTHFNDIYRTVKMMNITILIKLLEAHSRKPAPTQVKKEAGRSVVLKQAVDLGKGQKGQVQIQVATGQHQSASPVIAVPVAGSKALQVAAPGVKLPPGVKTKTVLARVQPQTAKSPSPASGKSTPKKLPIWKERKYTAVNQDPPPLEKWQIKEEEVARPTRFEWGDPDEPDPFLSSTLTNHALMEKQKEKHSTRKAEDIFDSVKSQTQSQSGVKRPQSQSASSPIASPSAEPPAAKIPKLDAVTVSSDEIIIPDPSPLSTLISVNLNENTVVEEVTTSAPETKPAEKKPIPILKPALKTAASKAVKGAGTSDKGMPGSTKDGSPQKTVRFAPEVEKENKEKLTVVSAQPSQVTTRVEVPVSSDGGDALVNHSKIISEVLRKFPDLVKDNKNIKLKIVQKPVDNSSNPSSSKETKSKVSYIVLKSTGGSDSTASTVLKKSPAQTSVSKFWETDKTPKKPSPAENTTGPWLCETCGEGENTALQFDTYYNFRRHLVEVHGERIDARICEYCGQKASKRNLLLYHMYTKHGVQPPKNCTFPHCDRCDYVALSESLLNKHKQNHDINKEFSCSICNASFKSSTALQGHMSANLHRNKDTKVYECPYCRKPFVRNINLKAHIRSLHRDVARIEEMEDPRLPPDESLTHRIIATTTSKKRQFPSILATTRGSSSSGLVEYLTAESLHDGQTVSYVTADGQPIEIIDSNQLSSLPLTLVSSVEDGISTVAAPMGLEGQAAAGSEYVSNVDDGSQAVYVMDGSHGAMEIDMANMGLTLSADGTVLYEGDDASQNFIVQDVQGNHFRRMAGIDETGKPVVFLQMIGEGEHVEMSPVVLDESMTVDESAGSSQMFVSSSGMTIPVTTDATTGQQVIFASTSADGTILEMVPTDSGSHQVVMSEAELVSHGQQINEQAQHLQLVDHGHSVESMQEVIHDHDQMGQPVQELHIVLDGQENSRHESQEHSHQEVLDIVEVRQSDEYITDSHDEIQLGETYTHSVTDEQHGHVNESESAAATDTSVDEIHEDVMTQEIGETQQIEIEESDSNQLQIHEEIHSSMEECETQEMEIDSEETQIVSAENLQESIELVEGQTLTLIEEEDGTQTIKVDDTSVEEITS
ncbi:unnamed protein product [Orchesella dallaii]|uniref:Centrosome-associated zinc finger protein CP190 n=1 Tax=Orchesella dallaii TaxID=48710 RepID=A0ABP1Q456_9HEXA